MELAIKGNKQTNYYNCSDGAKIEGAEALHSASLLNSWLQRPNVDVEFVRDFFENKLTFDLNFTEDDVEKLADHEAFYEVVDKFHLFLSNHELPKTRLDYVFMLQQACELLQNMQDRRHMFAVQILNSSVNIYFIMIIHALYSTAEEDKAIEHAENIKSLIIDFLEDARKLYQYMPKYYGDDHRKFFVDGKVGFDHPDSIAPVIEERKPLVTQEDRDRYPIRKFVKRYE